jgi:hypothetical protein
MGSKQKQTRQLQKERFEQLLAKRNALLVEKGIEKQKIAKDKGVKHLQAEINRTVRAIDAINAREKVIEKARLQKQKNAEKVKADKPKSKKQKAESAPEKKDKKEKKKKKSDKK